MQAALAYAERGFPVFPLQPKGKLPLIPREMGGRGFEDATTDPAKIREWWARQPLANIGVPTGRKAGFWALDIDKHNADGDATLAELELANGRLPATVAQKTGTGQHRLFKVNGVEVRNRAGKAGPGIDVRGDGGYIVVPPSIHPNGRRYEWLDGAGPDTEFAEAPKWLVDLLTKRPEPAPRNDPAARPNAYADAALVRELAELARATEGHRNEQLNISAFKLGQLVGAGHLSRSRVEISLRSNAIGLGLDQREVEATLKSGLDAGVLEPRTIPESRRAPQARAPAHDPDTGEVIEPPTGAISLEWFRSIVPSMDAFDFVEGLLTTAGLSVLYGEPGCGKTFLTLDLALHVALGWQWMDRAVDRGAVIYVALEGQRGLSNRIAAFRRHHGLEEADVPFAVVRSSVNMLNRLADVPALISAVKAAAAAIGMPVFLVVIDTLSRALCGGDENSSEDMGALIANAALVIAETQAHVCFVHHSGKDRARGSRGHSNLKGAVDTEIEIVRDEDSRISTAKIRKQKDLDLSSPFSFELRSVDLGVNRRGKPVTSCIVVPADTPPDVDDPVARMNDAERTALDEIDELMVRNGRMASPEYGMPQVLTVTRDQIREWFQKRGILGTDAKGNIDGASRVKLTRAMAKLKENGRIAVHGELVWKVDKHS